MSDWVIDNTPYSIPSNADQKNEWQIETPSQEMESPVGYGQALVQAPSKIIEDITGGAKNFLTNLPKYYESSKTEIPGAFNLIKNNPQRAGQQALGGIAELGKNVFNYPHDIVNYLSERLNLLPDDVNRIVQMGRMPHDTEGLINQVFPSPQQPGEALIRGIPRNALNIGALTGVASAINPFRYTSGGIAKNVLRESEKQIQSHSNRYNKIWNEADKSGFNKVPVDMNVLKRDFDIIEKYKTPKEYESLQNFINNPTLQNAQIAQSDMGVISRALEKKSRKSALIDPENSIFKASKNAEKHIESNMFKNEKGEINKGLQNKYNKLTKSYRKNVVPYRYNPAIQSYKAEEITSPELVNALSKGPFARQKGMEHPAIKVNQSIPKLGWLGAGLVLGKELFGAGETERNRYQQQSY